MIYNKLPTLFYGTFDNLMTFDSCISKSVPFYLQTSSEKGELIYPLVYTKFSKRELIKESLTALAILLRDRGQYTL